jgi:hypothetical protein
MFSTYVALVHQLNKKADYGVMFPDFPGCIFSGETLDNAMENARAGIIFHIEGMLACGEELPNATSLEKNKLHPKYKNATPILIRIMIPTGHLRRLNISMDAGLIAEIDHAARACGKNRSEFLADAAKQALA